jgi:uncharacterized protein (DUF1499 family)
MRIALQVFVCQTFPHDEGDGILVEEVRPCVDGSIHLPTLVRCGQHTVTRCVVEVITWLHIIPLSWIFWIAYPLRVPAYHPYIRKTDAIEVFGFAQRDLKRQLSPNLALLSKQIPGQRVRLPSPLSKAVLKVQGTSGWCVVVFLLDQAPCQIIEAYVIMPLTGTALLVRMAWKNSPERGRKYSIPEPPIFLVRWLQAILCIVLVHALVTVTVTWAENSGARKTMIDPCPKTPNCVSSLAPQSPRRMDPIPYQGSLEDARKRLMGIIGKTPRTKVVQSTPTYLKVEFRSKILSFIDDVEFEFDDGSKLIHFRSASRSGYYDFGVNRRRMEAISRAFASE